MSHRLKARVHRLAERLGVWDRDCDHLAANDARIAAEIRLYEHFAERCLELMQAGQRGFTFDATARTIRFADGSVELLSADGRSTPHA